MQKSSLSKILNNGWPSALVARTEIDKFTGGLVSPRTLSNLDSLGGGPRGRMRIGRKICYPVAEVIAWLESRAEMLDDPGVCHDDK